MDRVRVGDLTIAFHRKGSGPALVLLHGAVSDGRVWRSQLDSLAASFTVVAWDAPGCGGSSDPPGSFEIADYGEALVGLVTALDLAPVHLVGHSWGSSVALQVALLRPELLRSLVLVGGYAGWAGSLPPDEVRRRLAFALEAADDAQDFDPTTMRGLFSEVMPAERAVELAAVMRDARPAAMRTMARALAACDLSGSLGQVTVPTLILHGAADERSTTDVAEQLYRGIPGARLTVLPGLGHECYLESADDFEAALGDFLTAVDQA